MGFAAGRSFTRLPRHVSGGQHGLRPDGVQNARGAAVVPPVRGPLLVRSDLPPEVMDLRAGGLDDRLALGMPHLRDDGVDQPPAEIAHDFHVSEPSAHHVIPAGRWRWRGHRVTLIVRLPEKRLPASRVPIQAPADPDDAPTAMPLLASTSRAPRPTLSDERAHLRHPAIRVARFHVKPREHRWPGIPQRPDARQGLGFT